MNRVLVVGSTGSGKTTVAQRLAEELQAPFVELDALHWEPNWTMASDEDFRRRVGDATTGDHWVVDGNYYGKLNDLLWQRADTVIWLDLPFPLILWRVISRTLSRSLRHTELWSGNTEKVSGLWRKDSLVLWAFRSRKKLKERYGGAIEDPRWADVRIVRIRSREGVRRFLEDVSAERGLR